MHLSLLASSNTLTFKFQWVTSFLSPDTLTATVHAACTSGSLPALKQPTRGSACAAKYRYPPLQPGKPEFQIWNTFENAKNVLGVFSSLFIYFPFAVLTVHGTEQWSLTSNKTRRLPSDLLTLVSTKSGLVLVSSDYDDSELSSPELSGMISQHRLTPQDLWDDLTA